jgi:hypothetical protein
VAKLKNLIMVPSAVDDEVNILSNRLMYKVESDGFNEFT